MSEAYKFVFGMLIFYGVLAVVLFSMGTSSGIHSNISTLTPPSSPITPVFTKPELARSGWLNLTGPDWLDYLAYGVEWIVYILMMILNVVLMFFLYLIFFFTLITFSVSGLPWWFNVIIFSPIVITFLWILFTVIRGGGE
jgi:hypothetical protein